jgi:hypothetical protein
MQSMQSLSKKDILTQAIVTGAVVMVVFFIVSLFLPKQWLVSGKIVVFPSGSPATAAQTLAAETGNTAEIIKSESFQKNNFVDFAGNFAGTKVVKNSSVVRVDFRSSEKDIQAYEDLIVNIPDQVNDYARDLYGGSPFKYELIADPEISKSPVRPNLLLNSIIGFVVGFFLYLVWRSSTDSKMFASAEKNTEREDPSIVSPKMEAVEIQTFEGESDKKEKAESEKTAGEGIVVMESGRPHFVPGEPSGAKASAPANLPFVEDSNASLRASEEPSDEEVKDRLNRLMRGEL